MGNRNKTQVSVTAETHAKLKAAADAEGVTISTIVERALAPVLGVKPRERRWGHVR